MIFNIHEGYSETTGIRYHDQSDFSGEDFYHDKLNELFYECYVQNDKLILDLDGGDDGFTPSFLDESIGNLVYDFSLEVVRARLDIISNWEPYWISEIKSKTYPTWEKRRINKEAPKKTRPSGPWYKLVNGKLEKRVWIKCHNISNHADTL